MDETQRFLFDLQGYLVIPDVLNADELRRANEAIDANLASVSHSQSHSTPPEPAAPPRPPP